MSKIAVVFAGLKAKNKKGLIPFVTAGDPHPGLTVDVMHALVKVGPILLSSASHSLTRWLTVR